MLSMYVATPHFTNSLTHWHSYRHSCMKTAQCSQSPPLKHCMNLFKLLSSVVPCPLVLPCSLSFSCWWPYSNNVPIRPTATGFTQTMLSARMEKNIKSLARRIRYKCTPGNFFLMSSRGFAPLKSSGPVSHSVGLSAVRSKSLWWIARNFEDSIHIF